MPNNDFARLLMAIDHKEPDRVPLVETLVSYKIQSEFLGEEVCENDLKARVKFWKKAGYDYIPLDLGLLQAGEINEDSKIIKALGIKEDSAKEDSLKKISVIKEDEDFYSIDWGKISRISDKEFHDVKDFLPKKMKVIAVSGKIFTLPWMLMGFENFCECIYSKPSLVKNVIEKISEIQIEAIEKIIDLEQVGAVWIADDLAFGNGLIISQKHLREYIFPVYKKIVSKCHKKNKVVFFHSDGQIISIIEDLISIGFDALHPIDPNVTNLNIKDIKEEYGKRIAIFGNVDVKLLAEGNPEQVKNRVHFLLENIAPGGGFALGSGNSVPEWANIDNYKMMVKTVLEDGKYPISI